MGTHYGADPINFESVSAVTATPSVQLGTRRLHGGEEYEYVYAAGTVSMGLGAIYTGTSGNTVAATGATSGLHCAGFAKHESITAGSYGWLLKRGVVDAACGMTSSAPVLTTPLIMATDGKFAGVTVGPATSATDAVNGFIIGKVLSAGASGGTGSSYSLIYVSVY